jgi:FAD synthase
MAEGLGKYKGAFDAGHLGHERLSREAELALGSRSAACQGAVFESERDLSANPGRVKSESRCEVKHALHLCAHERRRD